MMVQVKEEEPDDQCHVPADPASGNVPSKNLSQAGGNGSKKTLLEYGQGSSRKVLKGKQRANSRRHLEFEDAIPLKIWPDPEKYNHRSLMLFTLQNPIRRAIIAAIEYPWWDRTVLLVISFNACALLSHDPYDVPQLLPTSSRRNVLHVLSQVQLFAAHDENSKLMISSADFQCFLSCRMLLQDFGLWFYRWSKNVHESPVELARYSGCGVRYHGAHRAEWSKFQHVSCLPFVASCLQSPKVEFPGHSHIQEHAAAHGRLRLVCVRPFCFRDCRSAGFWRWCFARCML